jgi:hypothetical protein
LSDHTVTTHSQSQKPVRFIIVPTVMRQLALFSGSMSAFLFLELLIAQSGSKASFSTRPVSEPRNTLLGVAANTPSEERLPCARQGSVWASGGLVRPRAPRCYDGGCNKHRESLVTRCPLADDWNRFCFKPGTRQQVGFLASRRWHRGAWIVLVYLSLLYMHDNASLSVRSRTTRCRTACVRT